MGLWAGLDWSGKSHATGVQTPSHLALSKSLNRLHDPGSTLQWGRTLIWNKLFLPWVFDDCVKVYHLHHGTARPLLSDGGDGLHIWTVFRIYWITNRRQPKSGEHQTLRLGRLLQTLQTSEMCRTRRSLIGWNNKYAGYPGLRIWRAET